MRIPLLRGRVFTAADRLGSRKALFRGGGYREPGSKVIVSETVERRLFDGDAVGKRLAAGASGPVDEVIGVVGDTRWRAYADDDLGAVYYLGENYGTVNALVLRSEGDAAAVLAAARTAIREFDPTMVVTSTATVDTLLSASVAQERFRAMLSGLFGGGALALATLGLYALAARRVADRRREIGVRVALGARPVDIRSLVVRDALRIVIAGLVIGLPAALAGSQLLRSLLFEVMPTSAHVFVLAAGTLAVTALVATLFPAARAARIDPAVVMRE
jgi:ABC-type antimicrobial peptide transport system permease subunit